MDVATVLPGWSGATGAAVGHARAGEAPTGCTVVLLPSSCRYGVAVAGGAASMRQVAALHPGHSVTTADAFLVVGGSAFGLDAAGGVMSFLEARGRGTRVGAMRVPAVPSAALFDLFVSTSGVRPDAATGLAACEDARTEGVAEGRAGAGAGATVGKIAGIDRAVWGGVGTAHVVLPGGLVVSALAVVNAFGNVHDPGTGACLGGARDEAGGFLDAEAMVLEGFLAARARALAAAAGDDTSGGNTTIGVVVTNGRLDGGGCLRAAGQASLALADCVRPCLTALDGDTVFLAATGAVEAESHQVGLAGRRALARAVARAVVASNGPGAGLPSGGIP